ncbi:hypothetical protein ACI78V_16185 [Geodermatophilus sp. SYSU D00742]
MSRSGGGVLRTRDGICRITFQAGVGADLELGTLAERMAGLRHLLFLTALAEEIGQRASTQGTNPAPESSAGRGGAFLVHDAAAAAEVTATNSVVTSVRYNSPLEVVISVTASAGLVLPICFRLVRLFERFQQARVGKAKADLQV